MDHLQQNKAKKLMASALPHTTLSYKLEKKVNEFLEDNTAGVKITIRSFSNEIQEESLWVTKFNMCNNLWLFMIYVQM